MKPITDFEVIRHGVDNAQYFQGCGIAFTVFSDVSTGIGATEQEALEDALDSIAQNTWDTSTLEDNEDFQVAKAEIIAEKYVVKDEGMYWYVSVRVK